MLLESEGLWMKLHCELHNSGYIEIDNCDEDGETTECKYHSRMKGCV